MLRKLNIPAGELRVRRDHNSRVAMEYYRGDLWSEYVAFDAHGPQCFRMPTAEFEQRFNRFLETPTERAALTFLRSLPSAHLPGDGVQSLLLEIFTMTNLNTTDLSAKTLAELTAFYNAIGATQELPPVKSFKSKPEAIKRIGALQEKVKAPTEKQKANGVSHVADTLAKAAKKAPAAKKDAPEKKGAVGKAKAKEAAKAKAAAKPKKEGGAARGSGIGAFCMDLIAKGKTNEEVLEAVKKKFPDAKTSTASIAWYRNKAKEE